MPPGICAHKFRGHACRIQDQTRSWSSSCLHFAAQPPDSQCHLLGRGVSLYAQAGYQFALDQTFIRNGIEGYIGLQYVW
jgi:hypothetical protein